MQSESKGNSLKNNNLTDTIGTFIWVPVSVFNKISRFSPKILIMSVFQNTYILLSFLLDWMYYMINTISSVNCKIVIKEFEYSFPTKTISEY